MDAAGDRLRAVLLAVAARTCPVSIDVTDLAPRPFRDPTTVYLQRQPAVVVGGVARVDGGGPVAVTVSHWVALKPGHLDGGYADADAACTQLVLVVRLPVERDVAAKRRR